MSVGVAVGDRGSVGVRVGVAVGDMGSVGMGVAVNVTDDVGDMGIVGMSVAVNVTDDVGDMDTVDTVGTPLTLSPLDGSGSGGASGTSSLPLLLTTGPERGSSNVNLPMVRLETGSRESTSTLTMDSAKKTAAMPVICASDKRLLSRRSATAPATGTTSARNNKKKTIT